MIGVTRKGRFLRDLVREYPQYTTLLTRLVEVLPNCRLLVFGTYGYGYLTYSDIDVLIWPGPNCMVAEAANAVFEKCLSDYETQESNCGYDDSEFTSIKVLQASKAHSGTKLNIILATKTLAVATQQSTIMLTKMPELLNKDQRRGVFQELTKLFKNNSVNLPLKIG